MTRLFRCLAMLALAGHLIILWAAATWEPRSLYWHVVQTTTVPELIPVMSLIAAVWLVLDVLLIAAFPGYCRIGDRLRFYPLAAALVVQGTVMFAGREYPLIWIDWGKDVLLTLFLMFSDALYNRRKYGREHGVEPEGDAHAEH